VTAAEQTLALFGGVVAFLLAASLLGYVLHRRYGKVATSPAIENLNSRIKAWWVMVALIGLAFAFGDTGVIILFSLVSVAALREFVTLMATRRGDHSALAVAFFVVLPLQYYLVAIGWYGLFSVFIPVYVFLLLPIIAALRADTLRYMERIAEVQWGVMICVFCISHVPALII
jgi:phosphatidate cytidylyltransferase